MKTFGSLQVVPFAHPQGCRGYLVADTVSKDALAIDVHLDFVDDMAEHAKREGWNVRYVIDTHTHADHPSGSREFAARMNCERVAHEKANHAGVKIHPKDGDKLKLGAQDVTIRHASGHTPDHTVAIIDGALFSGDSLFIGGVARTDFLGGDAGFLFDNVHRLVDELPETTVLYPGHDYENRIDSTLGKEKAGNPWLALADREEFVRSLKANPPPRPANMDTLLQLNRTGVEIPATISAADAAKFVAEGGASSVIDVRTGAEFDAEHIPGARLIPVDQIAARADEVRAVPAPRLLLCRSGSRATTAQKALEKLHVAGLSIVEGGISAYAAAGGVTVKGRKRMSIERQVRIGAGTFVLAGVLLGVFVNPLFLILSGFVGAGLIFAGITDWCGMGILLGKMPWNKASAEYSAASGGTCAASMPGACAAKAPAACAATPPKKDK